MVRARAFVLEDAEGNVRARLAQDEESVGLKLYDPQGRIRLEAGIRADDDSPGVALYDRQGRFRIAVCIEKGAPMIVLSDGAKVLAKLP